ncbi:hypothetical protein GCM10011415_07900 [Salipiger pallidus]|uniref:DUF4376 domain-containing protein n=1 Tax=Salipiger pallidus TaxID=1775170 RepID=A0A8J2ZH63_9RHOB|nr:DUF4376 domain-containing protein [Salipiger pallidus]GGG63839.1 hypothetical protein GCM10011415_07900 [Salipiger pallidus]
MSNIDMSQIITAEDKAAAEQASRKAGLFAERERRLAAGTTFNLSFGPLPMQGRPQDQATITALLQLANMRITAEDTSPLTFRDAVNTIHSLSPTEMIEAATAGMAWVEAVMAASWALVDSGDIPADYTDDAHWPA